MLRPGAFCIPGVPAGLCDSPASSLDSAVPVRAATFSVNRKRLKSCADSRRRFLLRFQPVCCLCHSFPFCASSAASATGASASSAGVSSAGVSSAFLSVLPLFFSLLVSVPPNPLSLWPLSIALPTQALLSDSFLVLSPVVGVRVQCCVGGPLGLSGSRFSKTGLWRGS